MDYSKDYNNDNYTEAEIDQIELAEDCGLTFTGFDDEGELEFVGDIKDFRKYWDKLNN